MEIIALTNNSLVYENLSEKEIFSEFIYDGHFSVDDILATAGKMAGKGHKLLLNPFFGNLPQYETPYKTLIFSEQTETVDFNSHKAISKAKRLSQTSSELRPKAFWGKDDLDCLKKSDLVVVERWLLKVFLKELMMRKAAAQGR